MQPLITHEALGTPTVIVQENILHGTLGIILETRLLVTVDCLKLTLFKTLFVHVDILISPNFMMQLVSVDTAAVPSTKSLAVQELVSSLLLVR